VAGLPGGRDGACFRYIECVMYMILLEGQMAFFAERVGFGLDCKSASASLMVAKKWQTLVVP
jgi:hypothetical protein